MHRVLVAVGGLLLAGAVAPASAMAESTGTTRCSGEQTNAYNVRVYCEVERVRRNERVTFPARPDCDRYRDFEAESTSQGLYVYASDSRSVPIPKFKLRDESAEDDEGRSYTLNVWVWANKKRIKFWNRSDMLVDVSFTMRCKV